ncbi:MAG TPA: 2,4-diaminopentanoate dehydrogenase [Coriobacteriia bacterium]|nr:2,4-diaminopentanoate dehydrogenase [Coriobacteriia bacterium]
MIKVAVWGAGMMGQGLLRYLLDRPRTVEVVGVIDADPAKEGLTVGEVLGDRVSGLSIAGDPTGVLGRGPDVVCVCTRSNLHEVTDQVEPSLRAGANVLCTAEALAYPWASDAAWAERVDALAREHGVSVLGTGINPGFVLDALIVMWTSVCTRVDRIEAKRVNDLSPFGPTVMTSQGVGRTVEEFERGVADGTIVGHIGFPESIHLIARALGWSIDEVVETREPIVSAVERRTAHAHVAPGHVAGCNHTGRGYSGGELKVELVHPQQVHPHLEGVDTGDHIRIVGEPEIRMATTPEVPGGIGTYASTGNYLPLIVEAPAGLLTVVDLPLPRFWGPSA